MPRDSFVLNGETLNRQILAERSLDFIADAMAALPDSSNAFGVIDAELERRRTEAVIQSADAAIKAAEAAKSSAASQARSIKYMFWTVFAMFATSAIQVVANVLLAIFSK